MATNNGVMTIAEALERGLIENGSTIQIAEAGSDKMAALFIGKKFRWQRAPSGEYYFLSSIWRNWFPEHDVKIRIAFKNQQK